MSSISQHISPDLIRLERTSIIYDVTDIVFSLKQHIPPPGGLLLAEVSLVLHRSHGQSKYAVYLPTRRRMNRSSTFMESWRFCPTAFLLRSGEFLPRHPFVFIFQGALNPDINSRLIRKTTFPHLYRNENRVLTSLKQKFF